MVVPFEEPITIRRDVAAQMKREVKDFCLAARDVRDAKERYRHEHPTPEQALDLYYREIDKEVALLHIAQLVLVHIIEPNFDYPL